MPKGFPEGETVVAKGCVACRSDFWSSILLIVALSSGERTSLLPLMDGLLFVGDSRAVVNSDDLSTRRAVGGA